MPSTPPVVPVVTKPPGVVTPPETNKDKIQAWIQTQSNDFLEKCTKYSNPALEVVSKLENASGKLDPLSPTCLQALTVS